MKRRVKRYPWVEGSKLVGMKLDGQGYRFVGTRFYQSIATGKVSELGIYQTECPDCSATFDVMIRVEADTFEPNRRCPECVNPSVTIRSRLTTATTRATSEP
jgi:hypothetical protein